MSSAEHLASRKQSAVAEWWCHVCDPHEVSFLFPSPPFRTSASCLISCVFKILNCLLLLRNVLLHLLTQFLLILYLPGSPFMLPFLLSQDDLLYLNSGICPTGNPPENPGYDKSACSELHYTLGSLCSNTVHIRLKGSGFG